MAPKDKRRDLAEIAEAAIKAGFPISKERPQQTPRVYVQPTPFKRMWYPPFGKRTPVRKT